MSNNCLFIPLTLTNKINYTQFIRYTKAKETNPYMIILESTKLTLSLTPRQTVQIPHAIFQLTRLSNAHTSHAFYLFLYLTQNKRPLLFFFFFLDNAYKIFLPKYKRI